MHQLEADHLLNLDNDSQRQRRAMVSLDTMQKTSSITNETWTLR